MEIAVDRGVARLVIVREGVQTDCMTLVVLFLDQVIVVCVLTDDEERGFCIVPVEDVEHGLGVLGRTVIEREVEDLLARRGLEIPVSPARIDGKIGVTFRELVFLGQHSCGELVARLAKGAFRHLGSRLAVRGLLHPLGRRARADARADREHEHEERHHDDEAENDAIAQHRLAVVAASLGADGGVGGPICGIARVTPTRTRISVGLAGRSRLRVGIALRVGA